MGKHNRESLSEFAHEMYRPTYTHLLSLKTIKCYKLKQKTETNRPGRQRSLSWSLIPTPTGGRLPSPAGSG